MLIAFSIVMFSSSGIYATNDTPIENTTNITLEEQTTYTPQSGNYTANSTTTSENTTNSTNSTGTSDAAAGETYDNIHGVWMTSASAGQLSSSDIDNLILSGITDIFVKTNRFTDPTYDSVLNYLLPLLNGKGIRVHAWITCFKDAAGNWVDPQGKYSYQVSVPYTEVVKVPYQKWYKGWYYKAYTVKVKKRYKSGKKWRYYWTYKTKYKRVYGWTYYIAYKDEYRTNYRSETRYGYSTTFNNELISFIKNLTTNYNIDGIHLDYVRYSGVGDNAAYKNEGGTAAITSFVQQVKEAVYSVKPKVAVSAALMPEGAANAQYYGQDYGQLANYLDFLVPMIYKGNYGQDTAWIGTTTKYIVDHAVDTNGNKKPVVAGLQTYVSDSNVTPISQEELQNDINTATGNGSAGYVLFRYGLISGLSTTAESDSSSSVTFTLNEIQAAAASVKTFIETNKRLPEYVTISTISVTMPEFLQLMTNSLLQLNNGSTAPVTFKNVEYPTNSPTDSINGNLGLSEYLEIAQRINTSINASGKTPDYQTSSLGNIGYKSLVYIYSKILNFYSANSRLPNYVTVDSYITNPDSNSVPAELQQYLQETSNCQVGSSSIQSLAASITAGLTSQYDKAVKIFNWVRDNLGYSFYYNTKYGAVGTLNARTGNCVDTSHLLIALERAAGIPARYVHGYCKFTSGNWYGHVWANVWVNGQWYSADATSSRNTFGVINNWNTGTYTLKGIYASLPF
ncbi:transglutaminase domain-containing protein [Methanobacterium sp.]|uniref:transglutaminase domain-containing protein n=1 Tax=Methanobacterium sp. TaxID=2164 RepID=UPI003D662868